MQILRLDSFPIEQARSLQDVEARLSSWCASLTFPVRLLVFSRAFDLRPAIARLLTAQRDLTPLAQGTAPLLTTIDRHLAGEADADPARVVATLPAEALHLLLDLCTGAPHLQQLLLGNVEDNEGEDGWATLADALDRLLWRLPWLKEQQQFYTTLQREHLRACSFLLITWEPPELSAATLVAGLRQATGRPVEVLSELPPLLACPYVPQGSHLRPEADQAPYLALGLSYDLTGTLEATTLHPLLDPRHDVALAIDIHTYPKAKAQRIAELAYNSTRLLAQDQRVLDTRAVGVKASSERVLFELKQQQLHTVEIVMLVSGASVEEARTHYTTAEKMLGSQVRFFQPPWKQAELLQYFSARPRTQITLPHRPRTTLSEGVGCLLGVLGYHRADSTSGVLWGIDAQRRAGLFFDLFANNQAAHMGILGTTGGGKTFFLNVLTERLASERGYRVIGIDDFDNGPRVARAVGAGAACYMLSMETPINILDVVYDEEAEGGWLSSQVQHVIAQLSLLLGTPGKTIDGKDRLIPRDLSPEETGLLDRALLRLYRDVSPATPLTRMPLLRNLIVYLETMREAEAKKLARTLRIKLFGTEDPQEQELTTVGRCFNAHTRVDWKFGADITYYNTANVPQMYRPFFYLQIIGAILRYMRDPKRDKRRKTVLAIDEFGYVTQIEALARLAAMITKVARKYGIGLIAIDQNPLTFLESENGRYIFENCPAKVAFRLDETPARQLATAIRDMRELHIDALTHFQPGQCLAVVRNDIYLVNVESSPREWRAFNGS